MGFIQDKIICIYKKISKKCKHDNIVEDKNSIDKIQNQITSMKIIYDEYKNMLLDCKNVKDYLEIKSHISSSDSIVKRNTYSCCKQPSKCGYEYKCVKNQFDALIRELSSTIDNLDQMMGIMDQINEIIEREPNKEFIHVKFYLDKYNDLVGFILNFNDIFSYYGDLTILGFIGVNPNIRDAARDKIKLDLSIFLKEKDSSLEIVDFFSITNKLRRRHGTLALQFLLECVSIININLEKDKTSHFKRITPITYIYGEIVPHLGFITYKDLYNFYESNGFIVDNKLKRYIL